MVAAIAEHRQGINADVVVYKNDGMLRLPDETDNLGIGIEDLPVVEYAFNRRQRRADEEIDLVSYMGYLQSLFNHFLFDIKYTLINSISLQQVLLKDSVCPLAEFNALFFFYSESH